MYKNLINDFSEIHIHVHFFILSTFYSNNFKKERN